MWSDEPTNDLDIKTLGFIVVPYHDYSNVFFILKEKELVQLLVVNQLQNK